MNGILVIASINVDQIFYIDDFPKIGETIFARQYKKSPGGKGNNIACTIKRIGGQVDIIGSIGGDENGEYIKMCYSNLQIDISKIIEHKNINTGTAFISVNSKGQNIIIVDPAANNHLSMNHINRKSIEEKQIIVSTLETPFRCRKGCF